jgi:hypothetical protein
MFHGKPLSKGEFVVTIASSAVDSVGILLGINARDSSIVVTHIDSDGAVAREGHGIVNVGDRLCGINEGHFNSITEALALYDDIDDDDNSCDSDSMMSFNLDANLRLQQSMEGEEELEARAAARRLSLRRGSTSRICSEVDNALAVAADADAESEESAKKERLRVAERLRRRSGRTQVVAEERICTILLHRIRIASRPLGLRFRSGFIDEHEREHAELKVLHAARKTARAERRRRREERRARNMPTWQNCNQAAARIQTHYRTWMTMRAIERLRQFRAWKRLEPLLNVLRAGLWIIVATYTAFMMYICLLYGLKFEPKVAEGWLVSSSIAFGIDILISQPLIALRAVLVETLKATIRSQSWIPKTHFKRTFWRNCDKQLLQVHHGRRSTPPIVARAEEELTQALTEQLRKKGS